MTKFLLIIKAVSVKLVCFDWQVNAGLTDGNVVKAECKWQDSLSNNGPLYIRVNFDDLYYR